jgi:Cu(I)/Ag(I) efflux system protein CusF
MRVATYLGLLAAPFALAACDSAQETPEAAQTMMDDSMPDGDGMPMSGDMPMMGDTDAMHDARAEGTVTAIDPEAGTITIKHGPIPAIDWPAMTMSFEADKQLRDQVGVGDAVAFEFTTGPQGSSITSIAPK